MTWHATAGRLVRHGRGRLPERPRRHPPRRRVRHRLLPTDSLARDRGAGQRGIGNAGADRRRPGDRVHDRLQPERHRCAWRRTPVDRRPDEHGQAVPDRPRYGHAHVTADRANRRPALPGGDGLLLDRGRLVVVQGSPAALRFLKLDGRRVARKARRHAHRSDAPRASTVARVHKLLLVVNADFATSTTPFTVTGLPRGGDD